MNDRIDDQVRRETHALTKSQQQEIERLNVESAEARILHEVSHHFHLNCKSSSHFNIISILASGIKHDEKTIPNYVKLVACR